MQSEERKELIAGIVEALTKRNSTLSEDEERWVKMAIQKEAQSIELRKAIIEKTLIGLVWAFFIGAGYVLLDFLRGHGVNV
jgi:hypothetical protein